MTVPLKAGSISMGRTSRFPESMLKMMLPVGSGLLVSYMFKAGKEHKKECRETRIDIDRRLKKALADW